MATLRVFVEYLRVKFLLFACLSIVCCDDLEEVQSFLDDYELKAQQVYSESAFASWAYNTNITDYNSQKSVSM